MLPENAARHAMRVSSRVFHKAIGISPFRYASTLALATREFQSAQPVRRSVQAYRQRLVACRPRQRNILSAPRATAQGSDPGMERTFTKPDLLQLVFDGSSVSIKAGATLLSEVPNNLFQTTPSRPQAANGALTEGRQGKAGGHAVELTDKGTLLGFRSQRGKTSSADAVVGKLQCRRWMASAKNKLWWMTPEWGTRAGELPPETQFLLIEVEEGGPYAVLLPLIDSNAFRCTLRPCGDPDALGLRAESGDTAVQAGQWDRALYIAAGWDPYALVDNAIPVAARSSGGARPRAAKEKPPTLDLFGWCTWDAFYFTVSARGIGQGLDSLRAGGTPPKWLVIDDGWQMTQLDSELRMSLSSSTSNAAATQDDEVDPSAQGAASLANPPTTADASSLANPAGLPGNEQLSANGQVLVKGSPLEKSAPAGASSPLAPESFAGPTTTSTGLGLGEVLSVQGAWRLATSPWRTLGLARGLVGNIINGGQSIVFDYANRYAQEAPLVATAIGIVAKGPILRERILAHYARGADHPKRLVSVQANSKFSSLNAGPDEPWQGKPPQLKEVVAQLKARHELLYVYAWHALAGYWAGISPQAPAMAAYDPVMHWPRPSPATLEVDPSMAWSSKVLGGMGMARDVHALHRDMHTYLRGAGVDGVKVDVQGTVGMCGQGLGGGAAVSQQHHASIEASTLAHFPGNHMINCMCHSSEDLYRMENTLIARCSDDFYPLDPASHTSHVGICAYNSVFMGALIQPDWDMFHSRHAAGLLHATARALSGGPVYVSDAPGAHDFDLLKRVVLPDGQVLRAQLAARPTRDCLFSSPLHDGRTALKVWNFNFCGGVVGAFNVQGASWSRTRRTFMTHDASPPTLTAVVRPSDVDTFLGFPADYQFAVYSDQLKRLEVLSLREGLRLRLAPAQSDIVTIAPIIGRGLPGVAPIGLVNMLNAGGAVVSVSLSLKQDLLEAAICVRGAGTFLTYSSVMPRSVNVQGRDTQFGWDDEQKTVRVNVAAQIQLESEVILLLPNNKRAAKVVSGAEPLPTGYSVHE